MKPGTSSKIKAAAGDKILLPYNTACTHKARHKHGTYTCYARDRCRCELCKEAERAYHRSLSRRHAYGQHPRVDAEPIRQHVKQLREQGMSVSQMAAQSGLHRNTINALLFQHQGKQPTLRMSREKADKLLALTPERHSHLLMNAVGARRRLQALQCLGYTWNKLAKLAGSDFLTIRNVGEGSQTELYLATHKTICELFDTYWMVPSTDRLAEYIRQRSLQRGYHSALEWDMETIDDPRSRPRGRKYKRSATGRTVATAEDVYWLADAGESENSIAKITGLTFDVVHQTLYNRTTNR